MCEKYIPWRPFALSGRHARLAFDGMRTHEGSLYIDLHQELNPSVRFSMFFDDLPLAMRFSNESFRLRSLRSILKPVNDSLYFVDNSNFLCDFHDESVGIYRDDGLTHISLLTDEWFDFVVGDLPTFVFHK